MGVRGELYTTQIIAENRAYFFNVKENRKGDVFLQIVESKKEEADERHAIVIFADELQKFCKGFESSLSFIEKDQKMRKKQAAEKKSFLNSKKRVTRSRSDDERKTESDGIKRSGRVHVVSKRSIKE
ncbi:MAG: DUF3276 family protein [Treponemataceae bacterium]